MAYVDSNVFLYPMLYSFAINPKARKARQILQEIEMGKLSAFTSTLTWDEVVWVVTRQLGRNDGIALGRRLVGFPNLRLVAVDDRVISQAQNLIEKYALSPRDSIHAASAFEAKVNTIISDDEDFDQIKELKRTGLE